MINLNTPQIEFLEKAEQVRNEGKNKGLLIFPTGLGKTFAAFSDALKFKGRLLILAHNQDLLRQHSASFRDLCKDRKMGFMYKTKKDFGANVIFGNVRTIKNHLSKFKRDEFDYIIIDETHHAAAKTYRTILDYFNPKFLLGMTATPTRTDRRDIIPLYDNNIILEYSEQEAIEKKWLRPYKIVCLWDKWCNYGDINGYRNSEGFYKYDIRAVGKKYLVPERIEGIIDILKNGINKNDFNFKGIGTKKGIYFSPRCIVAKRYCEEFNKAGIKSVYIDGKTSTQKRKEILKDFEDGKYQLILNVNLIGEGFHIPKVDMVIIDRPTDSKVLWNQQKGRQIFNIEGQDYDTKGLLIDFVGNSKNCFKHYTYNLPKKQYKKNEIKELVEKFIGVECEFQPEIIDGLNEMNKIVCKSLQEAIKEFKKVYGNNKQFRKELQKENPWIYQHFQRNNLLYKYCKKSKRKTLQESIIEFKRLYGDNKPFRFQLEKENPWIYQHFNKNNLLDKFCKKPRFKPLQESIIEFEEIYSNHKPFRKELHKENRWIYRVFKNNNLLDKYCKKPRLKTLKEAIKKFRKSYGDNKPFRFQLEKEHRWIYRHFRKNGLLDRYCQPNRKEKNIIIKSIYRPKTILLPKQKRNKKGSIKEYEWGGYNFKTEEGKIDIRKKIIEKIQDNDKVLLLESPELSAIKEIEQQDKKPSKIIIPNHLEFDKVAEALKDYKTDLKIELINTSVLQYLVDNEEKFDFIWLDYCGAFSYYIKDLDILFAKNLSNIKLVLTYNLFDPIKEDDSYYFTRVIDYVLEKVSGKSKVRLIKDISYRYKKCMYNLGFNIKEVSHR